MRRIELKGQTFGTWTVIEQTGNNGWSTVWLCRCACGAERTASGKILRRGQLRGCDTCGIQVRNKLIDLTGQRFGRLTVLRPEMRSNKTLWLCQCECGVVKTIRGKDLRTGNTKSCGCYGRNIAAGRGAWKGAAAVNQREYRTWTAMLSRCGDPRHRVYKSYGGRGITVCERWRTSFEAFLADMGPRPPGMSIDRIDNNGHYEPGNCRWATHKEQMRNTSANHYIEWRGERKIIEDWARDVGISSMTLRARIYKFGWPLDLALTERPRPGPRKRSHHPRPV